MQLEFSHWPPPSGVWGWVGDAEGGAVSCSAASSETSTRLACQEGAPTGPAGRADRSMAGPILPDLLMFDRGRELFAGILANSLDLARRVYTQKSHYYKIMKLFNKHTEVMLSLAYLP